MKEKVIIKAETIRLSKADTILIGVVGLVIIYISIYTSRFSDSGSPLGLAVLPLLGVFLCFLLFCFLFTGCELTVTDKRVFGTIRHSKRVDLPLDSISAVGTSKLLKGVSVSTSSGRITFYLIKNANEVYAEINKLLVNRTSVASTPAHTIVQESKSVDETERLRKYKDLLDSGVITQEEFDAKKKQLLGL